MEKPKNSRIVFERTDNTLDIHFPPNGFRNYLTIVLIGMEIILGIPVAFFVFAFIYADITAKIQIALFSIPWLAVMISLAYALLRISLNVTHLHLDREQITITQTWRGQITSEEMVAPTSTIQLIRLTERYISSPKTKYEEPILYLPHLEIRAGEQKCRFGMGNSELSKTEVEWLSCELSDWLGVEVITTQEI